MTDTLALIPSGIDTYRQAVVYMHEDCHICRAEGFAAQTRVRIDLEKNWIIATLNVVAPGGWLAVDKAALSASAWVALGAVAGDKARFSHPEPPASAPSIRAKAYGERLDGPAFTGIIRDTLDNRLTDIDLAAFVTACAGERLGASRVGLVAPYLGYMRQDRRFRPGQAISAPLFAGFLAESFDWLVTVDPHLHRIAELSQILPMPVAHVSAVSLLAEWIAREVPDAVLLGPDSESQQWVAEVARIAGRPYEVLRKVRTGDRQVEVSLPESAAFRSGTPVILDDIASSGRTMVRAVERLRDAGASAPVCVVIHAVFAGSALNDIFAAGAARVVTTDTIAHRSNAVSVAGILAKAIPPSKQSHVQQEPSH